jgi:ubiquinone/menaquinone biosynthesis C-methylase UbiE
MIQPTLTWPASDPYEALRPLMQQHGACGSARDFYWAVNRAYHTIEARDYDALHETMFLSLEPVWRALFAHAATHPTAQLRVLDVGAGTGLVGMFAEMHLAGRLASWTMLDPCAAMLEQARRRAELFSFPCTFHHGDLDSLGDNASFDVITINSVLHHIVDLPAFCARVKRLLHPNGWLLTGQDPRAEAAGDPEFMARRRRWRRGRRNLYRSAWTRLGQFVRSAVGQPYLSPLAQETSLRLMETEAIRRPLTMAEIYAVTDFHVPGQPGGLGRGISLGYLRNWLEGMTLVEGFTYQFHGAPWINLSRGEQAQERQWWDERDAHGELLASVWRRSLSP